jgi:hypothetical protein
VRRLFWLGLGVAVGALVVRQATKAARAYAPAALATAAGKSGARLMASVGDFIADVREGMAEREERIHLAFARGESLADLDAGYDEEDEYDEYR